MSLVVYFFGTQCSLFVYVCICCVRFSFFSSIFNWLFKMLNWSATYALLLVNQLSERWYTLHILLRWFWRCRAFKNLESLEKRFKTDVLSAFVRAHASQKSSPTHDDRKQTDLWDSRFQRPHPQQPGYGRQDQFVMLCVTYFLRLSWVVTSFCCLCDASVPLWWIRAAECLLDCGYMY